MVGVSTSSTYSKAKFRALIGRVMESRASSENTPDTPGTFVLGAELLGNNNLAHSCWISLVDTRRTPEKENLLSGVT